MCCIVSYYFPLGDGSSAAGSTTTTGSKKGVIKATVERHVSDTGKMCTSNLMDVFGRMQEKEKNDEGPEMIADMKVAEGEGREKPPSWTIETELGNHTTQTELMFGMHAETMSAIE